MKNKNHIPLEGAEGRDPNHRERHGAIKSAVDAVRERVANTYARLFGPTCNPIEFQKTLDQELEKAIAYLGNCGITINKKPKIVFVNKPQSETLRAAQANVEEKMKEELLRYIAVDVWIQFNKLLGFTLSREALEEEREKSMETLTKNSTNNFPDGADIVVYRPNKQKPIDIGELVFHELWHVVESEKVATDKGRFIIEGTATFAQHYYKNTPLDEIDGLPPNFETIAYKVCAQLVHAELEGDPNPLLTILTPEFREKIGKEFGEHHLQDLAFGIARMQLDHPEVAATQLRQDPDFDAFIENPTKENYITCIRKKGYTRSATELESQGFEFFLTWIGKGLYQTQKKR